VDPELIESIVVDALEREDVLDGPVWITEE
jgi:hypothetical protein